MFYLCRWYRYNDVIGVWLVLWRKEATVMEEQAVVGRRCLCMYVGQGTWTVEVIVH